MVVIRFSSYRLIILGFRSFNFSKSRVIHYRMKGFNIYIIDIVGLNVI
jgi:hypothetical protein